MPRFHRVRRTSDSMLMPRFHRVRRTSEVNLERSEMGNVEKKLAIALRT